MKDNESTVHGPVQSDGAKLASKPVKSRRTSRKTNTSGKKEFVATICPDRKTLFPAKFVTLVQELEAELKKPVWFLVQGDDDTFPFGRLGYHVTEAFVYNKEDLPPREIALIIDSPGGYADDAFRLAMLLRRRCGSFVAVIPRWAKSAATLLSLGASEIYLGEDAQLGPLDAQFEDPDKEEAQISALDEVGAVEALEEATIEAAWGSLRFIQERTRKKLSILMPDVFDFVARLHRPLFDKIDTLRYSRMSRILRIAEQYAVRLLQPRFSENEARVIADKLVKRYPSHRFAIMREEAKRIGRKGLQIVEPTANMETILTGLYRCIGGPFKAIGRLEGVVP